MRAAILSISTLAFVLLLGASGCDASGHEVSGPYAADIRQAQASATSDFERDVLKDGKVTAAEYSEAQSRLIRCVADHGYLLEAHEFGYRLSGYHGDAEQETASDIKDECARGTVMVIESIYIQMTYNPEKEDQSALIAACLVRHDMAPKGFTGSDFDSSFGALNPPYDPDDPRYGDCINNPKGL